MFHKPRSRCDRCGESITSAQLRTHKGGARCQRGQRRCALCGDEMRYSLDEWNCISCSRKPHVIEVSESETGKVVDTIKFKNRLAAKTARYQIAVQWGRLYDVEIKMETDGEETRHRNDDAEVTSDDAKEGKAEFLREFVKLHKEHPMNAAADRVRREAERLGLSQHQIDCLAMAAIGDVSDEESER